MAEATQRQQMPAGVRRFAWSVVGATFALLLVGGTVNPTGSSLACPDWPTCYGSFFPQMKGGVLFEHTHRLVASGVGLLTLVLAVVLSVQKRASSRLRKTAWLAVSMVLLQGLLGGLTVIYRLPTAISVAHLALSMLFFLTLIYIAHRCGNTTQPPVDAAGSDEPTSLADTITRPLRAGTAAVTTSLVLVYAQLLLGALVRHTRSGHACGRDPLLCSGVPWPTWQPGQLHMVHRIFALVVFGAVLHAAISALRQVNRKTDPTATFLAVSGPWLAALQIGLGLVTVASGIAVAPVTAHLGLGALLLANQWLLRLRLSSGLVMAKLPPTAPSRQHKRPRTATSHG